MGMDVYGKNATSERGEYFRNNVWWWRPLADYCIALCDAHGITESNSVEWHSNDGTGLNAANSIKLSRLIKEEEKSGALAKYATDYENDRLAVPRDRCKLCEGTGIRRDSVGYADGMPTRICTDKDAQDAQLKTPHPRLGEVGWCNGCHGVGTKENISSWYAFSSENAIAFADFLADCGGFEIC